MQCILNSETIQKRSVQGAYVYMEVKPCPWKIEKISRPTPFPDINVISLLDARDLVNMSLRSHVFSISPASQLQDETLGLGRLWKKGVVN